MKIMLVGGGTMGSASPLLAIYEEAKKQGKNWDWFWIGTKSGPERPVVEALGIGYEWMPTAKLRRYFAWRSLADPIFFIISFFRSLLVIVTIKPDVVVSAGSFVGVPVIWAAWFFRRFIIIHQQDIRPTLSNKLTAWCASKITVSFSKSLLDYPHQKTELIGNPIREWVGEGSVAKARELWKLNPVQPTILVIGGSSGSSALNKWVWEQISRLVRLGNLIHITGAGRVNRAMRKANYTQIGFLDRELAHALAAADVVVSRAGISMLSELSYLSKPTVLVPMPGTHQEDNAFYFANERAACLFRQDQLNERVVEKIAHLLAFETDRKALSEAIGQIMAKTGRERMVEMIEEIE